MSGIVKKYEDLNGVVEAKFDDIKSQTLARKRAVQWLSKKGVRVGKQGKLFVPGKGGNGDGERKPDVVIAVDKSGNKYLRLKGRTRKKGQGGANAMVFPSRYQKNFNVSMQSWGGQGARFTIEKSDVETDADEGTVTITLPPLVIYPKKGLKKVRKFFKTVKPPVKESSKEEEEDEEEDEDEDED